jgi:hypothetical protein
MPGPLIIDFKKLQVYEAGALLLTHLAYPERTATDDQRGGLHATLCALALHELYGQSPEWETPQFMKPIYAFRTDKQIDKDLRTFPRRMRDRAIAGRMAMAFLMEAETGKVPELPEGIKRLSLNEISAMVLDENIESEPENIETRTWRPSRPVIHLAAAIQYTLQKFAREKNIHDVTYMDFLLCDFLIEYVVRLAQIYESYLPKSKLEIKPEELIRFRLASDMAE